MAATISFLDSVNAVCNSISAQVDAASLAHHDWFDYCVREQLKAHDPKARSYGLVAQLIDTDPRKVSGLPIQA